MRDVCKGGGVGTNVPGGDNAGEARQWVRTGGAGLGEGSNLLAGYKVEAG